MIRAIEIARRLCPRAKASYLAAIEAGDGLLVDHEVTTPLRLAHFLAQAFHETDGLSIEWESGAYSAPRLLQIFGVGHHSAAITPAEATKLAYDAPAIFERVYGLGNPHKAAELGNTVPGDGYRYRGGGILQTTGRGTTRASARSAASISKDIPNSSSRPNMRSSPRSPNGPKAISTPRRTATTS
jgi:putative chitinase